MREEDYQREEWDDWSHYNWSYYDWIRWQNRLSYAESQQIPDPRRTAEVLDPLCGAGTSPQGSYPRSIHVDITWNTFGAGQVCPPARPDRGQYPCQEQTTQ
jgi:hypothetical protein